MNYENLEIAVIMKKVIYEDGIIEYIPIDVIEGIYNEEKECIIDLEGKEYYHIITNPDNIGFIYRDKVIDYMKNYKFKSLKSLKKRILKISKKSVFIYTLDTKEENMPIVLRGRKRLLKNSNIVIDKDILYYYQKHYPKFTEEVLGLESNIEEKPKSKHLDVTLDINKMYDEITKIVIDQDEPIKKILTAIWKQYNNFSDSKSRNILINGSTGVGKTETFRQITKRLQIPYFIANATDYTAEGYIGKSVKDMLIGLLKNANYDLERAQRGILIIDEIDKLAESSQEKSQVNKRDVQEALLKLLEDGMFTINVNNKEYVFDTSKLMVIAMGSWSRIELEGPKVIGFESKQEKKKYKDITREDMISSGMIPELIGRLPIVVQMNELELQSFIRILNSDNSILNINKIFFDRQGIKLSLNEEVQKEIARRASEQKLGARSLDEIVETTLSAATFEIARNPNTYRELIITPETLKDNKKFTLVRKK